MYSAFWTSFISHSLFSICFLGHTSHLELAALWNHRGVVVMIVKPTGWTILPCMMHSLPIMSLYHSFNKPMPSVWLSVLKQGRYGLPKWGTSKFDGARKVVTPLTCFWSKDSLIENCTHCQVRPSPHHPPLPLRLLWGGLSLRGLWRPEQQGALPHLPPRQRPAVANNRAELLPESLLAGTSSQSCAWASKTGSVSWGGTGLILRIECVLRRRHLKRTENDSMIIYIHWASSLNHINCAKHTVDVIPSATFDCFVSSH